MFIHADDGSEERRNAVEAVLFIANNNDAPTPAPWTATHKQTRGSLSLRVVLPTSFA